MDRVPLIVVATGVVLVVLIVIFAAVVPWGAAPPLPVPGSWHERELAGFGAHVARAEPGWERGAVQPDAVGEPGALEIFLQSWRHEGTPVAATLLRFDGPAAAWEHFRAHPDAAGPDRPAAMPDEPLPVVLRREDDGASRRLVWAGAIVAEVSSPDPALADRLAALVGSFARGG